MKRQSLEEDKVYSKVQTAIQINKEVNLFHKAFLRPIQIALKTKHTEKDPKRAFDSLAFGLKNVIKDDITNNQYVLQDFHSIDDITTSEKLDYRYLVDNNYDNMISLMKPGKKSSKIKLSICICMYSQDKSMLRKTLSGVAENIATFVRNGISSDQIAVCVVMDGIQKVDNSVISFFEELEKQSNIYLDNEIDPMSVRDVYESEIKDAEDEQVWNLSNFIFDEIQMADRKKRRFYERKKQYQEVKQLINRIEILQKDRNTTFYDLDDLLKQFFFQKAKIHYEKNWKKDQIPVDSVINEDLINIYADNIKLSKPIIQSALYQAKGFCYKYVSTRDDLSLLNAFRVNIQLGGAFTKMSMNSKYEPIGDEQNPNGSHMNLFMITKYKNMGKLSSHNWFFNGFCQQIPCQYAVLLDVGLTPSKNALYKMYKFMDNDPKCGGVCGYMKLRMEGLDQSQYSLNKQADCVSRFTFKLVDIQRAQQVQYHFGHLLDKSFQSFFNFIHVLPGAFSAYRMSALKLSSDQSQSSQLMKQYFKSLDQSTSDIRRKAVKISPCDAVIRVLLPDVLYRKLNKIQENTDQQLLYDSNVYLAQDRTLCMGIHENGYNLQYLPDASGFVDPIKTVPALLGQRKRWINGSFFAFGKVRSSMGVHGCSDCILQFQVLYLAFMNMFAFVAPAFFLFTVHIAMFAFRDWAFRALQFQTQEAVGFQTLQFYNAFVYVIDFIYVLMMLCLILFSLHFSHRNPRYVPYIYGISTTFGILAVIVFIVLLYDIIAGLIDGQTFLVSSPQLRQGFFNSLPGGQFTFFIYKYVVIAVLAAYAVPIAIYSIAFHRCSFIFQILCGSFSFLFYTPTYLNVLNAFALCRIDDISWGTKGLDSTTGGRTKQLVDTWKTIKIIYIAKYIFWNIIVGAALLVVSSPIAVSADVDYLQEQVNSYVRKFFVTFGIMALIFITLLIKIICGLMYTIKYRCCKKHIKIHKTLRRANFNSPVYDKFSTIKGSIYLEIKHNIYDLVNEVKKEGKSNFFQGMNSIILKSKSINRGKPRQRSIRQWDASHRAKSQIKKKKQNPIMNNEPEKNNQNIKRDSTSQYLHGDQPESSKNLRSDDTVELKAQKKFLGLF